MPAKVQAKKEQGKRDKYRQISHSQRIMVIYLRIVHNLSLDIIKARSGVKYNTIRNILQAYRKYGLTNTTADDQVKVIKDKKGGLGDHLGSPLNSQSPQQAVSSLNSTWLTPVVHE